MKTMWAAAAAILFVPGAAVANDFDGVRAEARLGWETPTVSEDEEVFKIESDISYGGEVGYDFAASDHVVVGPYAVYEFSNVNICDGGDCLREDGNLGAGVRVGWVASPDWLVYGKLGYAQIRFTANIGAVSGSDSEGGIQGAIGANYNFNKNVYGLVEINYGDYGKFADINLQRRHVVAGVGVRF